MATASGIPQNVSFFIPNHYRPRILSQKTLKPTQISRKIYSRLSRLASNGVQIIRNEARKFGEASETTVLGPRFKFLELDSCKTHSKRGRIVVQSMGSSGGKLSTSLQSKVFGLLHLLVSLGIILAVDKYLKKAFVAAAIKFPSALFGMFCIFTILVVLDSTIPAAATGLMNFFEPALLFIQRWLPLFYVPSLVVLPLAVKDIPAASGVKICAIIGTVLWLLAGMIYLLQCLLVFVLHPNIVESTFPTGWKTDQNLRSFKYVHYIK